MPQSLLYRIYERRLAREIADGDLPCHVGVILDGNRRYAAARGLADPSHGHEAGAANIDRFLEWCLDLEIPYVTLWLLSTENLAREDDELERLLRIIGDTVERISRPRGQRVEHRAGLRAGAQGAREARSVQAQAGGVRITAVGALDLLPDEVRLRLKRAEEATAHHDRMRVQVAVGYGGRQEITDALRSLLRDRAAQGMQLEEVADTIGPSDIGEHLYATGLPDPDLIIRTSGELRLSGFLMWQAAHAEYHFCDAYWPDFRRIDFLRALRDYQRRTRRYGR